MDQSLFNSYELKFLKAAIEKVKENNAEGFQDECLKLKSRCTLDRQKESMLAEILDRIKKGGATIEGDEFNPL